MSPQRKLIVGLGGLIVVASLATVAGSRRQPTSAADIRPSSYLTEPNGARAFAETLERLGIVVRRLRSHRPQALDSAGRPGALIVLNPTSPASVEEAVDLAALPARGISLLVAGPRSRAILRCFGYDTLRLTDSATVRISDGSGVAPQVRLGLRPSPDSVVTDSTGVFDTAVIECRVPAVERIDTLLVTEAGQLVAARLYPAGEPGTVTLVSDVNLFRNRTWRDTEAGPVVLDWVVGRFGQVWFDEYHHGYLSGGSLVVWTLRWSRESPWGWLSWHVGVVGLIALGFAAIRFGPPIAAIDRRRRSVAEHARALAFALRAAGGHRAAIGVLIDGLRRRLTPASRVNPALRAEWLAHLGTGAASPEVERLSRRLQALDREPGSERAVLETANVVEDLWKELRT
jgi:hypothetical protein